MLKITEQLIAYIIQHLSGKITKTQLIKLMYLADDNIKGTLLLIVKQKKEDAIIESYITRFVNRTWTTIRWIGAIIAIIVAYVTIRYYSKK